MRLKYKPVLVCVCMCVRARGGVCVRVDACLCSKSLSGTEKKCACMYVCMYVCVYAYRYVCVQVIIIIIIHYFRLKQKTFILRLHYKILNKHDYISYYIVVLYKKTG